MRLFIKTFNNSVTNTTAASHHENTTTVNHHYDSQGAAMFGCTVITLYAFSGIILILLILRRKRNHALHRQEAEVKAYIAHRRILEKQTMFDRILLTNHKLNHHFNKIQESSLVTLDGAEKT